MSEESVQLILSKLEDFKESNKSDHKRLTSQILGVEGHAKHTNGTVADLVKWKIQANVILKIFGFLIIAVVVPVAVTLINDYLSR